jgi:hypothetical protein
MTVQGSFSRADGALLQDDNFGMGQRAGAPALHSPGRLESKSKSRSNATANGQECPFHTGGASPHELWRWRRHQGSSLRSE